MQASFFLHRHWLLTAILLTLSISNCPSVLAQTPSTGEHQAHHAQTTLDWPGIYFGFLPCADCDGTKTSLALNKNGTYLLMTQNVGKSLREFTEKGKFTWSDADDTITLTSHSGGKTHQYFVGQDMLVEVDPATGKHSSSHILRRTDVTAKPPKHSH